MTRFESPGQVALLFLGAALVSLVLVALLNVEARNRKIKEPEIENGNLFQVLGNKLLLWARRMRHHNTSHADSGITAHRQKRGLKSIRDEGNNKVEHPVRHHGKHRRKPAIAPASTVSSYAQNVTLEHEMCYSANQVLCIIAVTCAVNFAFIFVVMTLVHVCNRQHGTKLSGLDSLTLAEGGEGKLPRDTSCSYSSVQEYVNSLPSSASMLSLQSMRRSLRKTYSMEDLLST